MYGRVDTNTVTTFLPESSSFFYDRNGNLLSDGTKGFEYDDENQLIRITATNSWKSEFSYDGLLRRRIKKEYTWTGSAWSLTNEVRYVCDGMLVLQERDGSNTPKVTYTRGPDQSFTFEGTGDIGGLLARTENGASVFYHGDGSGNVTALVDSQQFLAAQYLYDPFGNTISMSGPLAEANTYRFSRVGRWEMGR